MVDVVWAGMRCLHGPKPSVSVLICGYPHSWKRKPDWVARRGCIAIVGVTIPRDTRLSMRGLRAPSAFGRRLRTEIPTDAVERVFRLR